MASPAPTGSLGRVPQSCVQSRCVRCARGVCVRQTQTHAFLTRNCRPQVGLCLLSRPSPLSLPGHRPPLVQRPNSGAQNPSFESKAPFTVLCSFLLNVAFMEIFSLTQGDIADQTPIMTFVTLPIATKVKQSHYIHYLGYRKC